LIAVGSQRYTSVVVTLRIHLFGPLRLAGGEAGPLLRLAPRAQRLLAYLLLRRDATLEREHIAFKLWPDQPETEALSALRRALSDLRAGLPKPAGHEWILVQANTLRWNAAAEYWLDVAHFEQLMAAGTSEALLGAAELCADDLLPGWGEEWLDGERERLLQMRLEALRRLATHYRARGELGRALHFAQRQLALDPLAEASQRQLMALHYAAGDRAAALAQYAQFRAQLQDELGVEPMPDTQALAAAIGRGEPLPAAQPPRPANPKPRAVQMPPVGRETETVRLNDWWDQALRGAGRLVIVSGEAGVGKSRLLSATTERAAARGGLCLVGQSYEFENALPYQPIVEMLRTAAGLIYAADLAPAHRALLARLAPDVLGAAASSAAVQDDQRGLLFEALLQAFVALARAQPLLLLFEDVHWAAGSTLDWLTYVTPRLGASPILVIITYRTGEIDAQHALARLEQRFAREGALSTLSLRPLTREANQELVAQFSGLERGASQPLADRLFAETGGNPFFLSEVVRGLIEAGQIVVAGGQWTGRFTEAAGVELPLPESLRLTIIARVERLTEMTRAFLHAAAVAGRVFHYDLVQRAGGWADPPALEALDQAIARGFVHEQQPGGSFVFAHHLVQEAIYAALTAPRRAYWHRRLAEVLETIQPEEYEGLAHHWTQAGEAARAATFYLKAGDRARALMALPDAAAHYQAAAARWPSADPAGRADALFKLGQCQWVLMETHSALESLQAARGLFEQVNQRRRMGDTERLIGRAHWELGDTAAAWPHYRRALAILEQEGETVEWARAVSAISQMHMLAGEFDQAQEWGQRALALGQKLGAEDVIVHALNNIGISLTHTTRGQERGLALLRESRDRAQALGSPHDACRAYINLGEVLTGLARYAEARTVYADQLAYSTRVQARAFMGSAAVMLATLDWLTGRWRAALARHAQIVALTRTGSWEIWAGIYFGRVNNDLGRHLIAVRDLEANKERALKWTEMQTVMPHMGQLARAYAATGMRSEAEAALQLCRGLMERNAYLHPECLPVLLTACAWYLDQGQRLPRLDDARACLALLERADRQLDTPETRAALAETRGLLGLAEGAPEAAAEQLQAAVAGWAAIDRPLDQARALSRLGRAQAAAEPFRQAMTIIAALAEQIDEPGLKASFLDSGLARDIQPYLEL
jgi:DNA-binding SARP family transcriptional activator